MDKVEFPLSLAFLVISLAYAITLMVFFFSKRRVKTSENRIFGVLLIMNIVCILMEILCIYSMEIFHGINFGSLFVNRLFLVALIIDMTIVDLYVTNLVEFSEGISTKNKKLIQKVLNYGTPILALICIVLVFPLDIGLYKNGNKMYSYGPAVNVVFAFGFFNLSWCIIYLFLTSKVSPTNRRRNIPVFVFLVGFFLCAIIQKIFPYITLTNSVSTFFNLLVYHSIENPMFKELAIAKDVATEANSAKKDFLSSMSHEIRTPLNAIVGLSQVMDQTDDLEEIHKDTKEMFIASHNLLDIFDSILDANSISANELEIENSDYILRDELDNITRIIDIMIMNKNIKFQVNYSDELPYMLNGDVRKVKRVMSNLLTNAAKYTDQGLINFNVGCENKFNTCILKIEIKDTGRGMSEEQKSKLFEQFYRLDDDKDSDISGVGLGLSITKSFVDIMKGKIDVETAPDLGTIVRIELPQKIVKLKNDETIETL